MPQTIQRRGIGRDEQGGSSAAVTRVELSDTRDAHSRRARDGGGESC
ncbi:Hypothetical protein A7982_07604 [Minicystis rosea]|nr:Hypothetical protein A7982_07604 [Minicystis rosea]